VEGFGRYGLMGLGLVLQVTLSQCSGTRNGEAQVYATPSTNENIGGQIQTLIWQIVECSYVPSDDHSYAVY
jgi:hypothetical protein